MLCQVIVQFLSRIESNQTLTAFLLCTRIMHFSTKHASVIERPQEWHSPASLPQMLPVVLGVLKVDMSTTLTVAQLTETVLLSHVTEELVFSKITMPAVFALGMRFQMRLKTLVAIKDLQLSWKVTICLNLLPSNGRSLSEQISLDNKHCRSLICRAVFGNGLACL